jgi:hypothetical protein
MVQAVTQQVQEPHDLTDRVAPLPGIDNAKMFITRGMATQKVLVLSEDDSASCQGECYVTGVVSSDQPRVARGCDVDSPQAQAMGDCVVDVFVKVIPDHETLPR